MNQTSIALAKEFRDAKNISDDLTAQLKKVDADWGEIETKLLDAMVEEGVRSVDIEGVGKLSMRVTNYLSVNAANKPRMFEYLKATGNGALIKEDVNPKTLTSFLGKHLEELIAVEMNEDKLDLVQARTKALGLLQAEGASYFTKRGIALGKE